MTPIALQIKSQHFIKVTLNDEWGKVVQFVLLKYYTIVFNKSVIQFRL